MATELFLSKKVWSVEIIDNLSGKMLARAIFKTKKEAKEFSQEQVVKFYIKDRECRPVASISKAYIAYSDYVY